MRIVQRKVSRVLFDKRVVSLDLAALKKDYVNAYGAQHSKARLGVAEDKTKTALRKDRRVVALRARLSRAAAAELVFCASHDMADKIAAIQFHP